MQGKIDSKTYILIFAVSFIGFIMAFFLGLWVGGKSTPKYISSAETVSVNEEDFSPDYEEIEKSDGHKTRVNVKESGKEGISSQRVVPVKTSVKKPEKEKISAKTRAKVVKTNKKPSVKKKKKPARKSVVKKAKKSGKTRYMLQIGAFKRLSDAKKFKVRFERKGYSVFIVKEKGKKSIFYKVRIGTFYSKSIALQVKKKIAREDKIKAWLVPIK